MKSTTRATRHIVIDARGRRTSTGRYVDRLVEHLQRLDTSNRYSVLVEPDDPWEPAADNFRRVPCRYKRFSFNILDQFTFAFFLRRLKPDLVHFSMTPQEPMFYTGIRVTTTHDLTMFRFVRPGRLPRWLHEARMVGYRLLFWRSLRAASKIVVPSEFVAKDVSRKYPFAKTKVAVTYESSEPPLGGKAEHPAGVKEPFIMHVGSPFPHKNIGQLVDAFAILKKRHPDLQLVLAGKREQYFEALERNVQKNSPFRDDIVFTGFVSDAALKWLYQNAEAYVLPALSEGFGLPGLEAMAHGLPLVSSDTTCLPEIYGDAAHYFDPESPLDMAGRIHEVLADNELRKRLIQNGYVRIKKYSWRRMAKQTLGIYQDILGETRG